MRKTLEKRRKRLKMVEPVEAAAVADELSLLDFMDQNPPQKPCSSSPMIRMRNPNPNSNSLLFDDLLDSSFDSIPGLLPSPLPPPPPAKNSPSRNELNAEEEEEELEWLANKDAFPSLESLFEIATDSSPVSVLPPSFKVPVKARSKLRRKRRRVFPPPPVLLSSLPPPSKGGTERRRCRHCEVEETPQWRMGPEGPKTLCNACGVRYTKGRLFPEYRPANSPTFSATIHSNSTRKVMEMRLRRGRPGKRGRPRVAAL